MTKKPNHPKTLLRKLYKDGECTPFPFKTVLVSPVEADAWAEMTIMDVRKAFMRLRRGQRGRWQPQDIPWKHSAGKLTVLVKRVWVWWAVNEGAIGAGKIHRDPRDPKPIWEAYAAGIVREHRGKGIYPAVLAALKQYLGEPIYSDTRLSAAALSVWKRIGTADGARRRFRNPRPEVVFYKWEASVLREAVNWYASR